MWCSNPSTDECKQELSVITGRSDSSVFVTLRPQPKDLFGLERWVVSPRHVRLTPLSYTSTDGPLGGSAILCFSDLNVGCGFQV